MSSIAISQPATSPTTPEPSESSRHAAMISGVALVVLGIVRAYPDGIGLSRYLWEHRSEVLVLPERIRWIDFPGALWAVWPILLGLALVLSRSRRLLKGAAITAIVMGIERTLFLLVGASFEVVLPLISVRAPSPFRTGLLPRGVLLGLAIASAAGWLWVGRYAFLANSRWRQELRLSVPTTTRTDRRPAGRLATFGSCLIGLGLIGSLGWTTYLEVLERVPWIRGLILKDDRRAPQFFRKAISPEARRFREANGFFDKAQAELVESNYAEARTSYAKALNRYQGLVKDFPKDTEFRRQYALTANNLAWLLVTCPDTTLRDPEVAIELGNRAVGLYRNDGNAYNTLAVAHYRAGDLDSAQADFDRSMALRRGGDSFDWFFLAAMEAGRGNPEKGREWYDKSVIWMTDNRPRDPELARFQAEAAAALGLPKPAPPLPILDLREPGLKKRPALLRRPGAARRLGQLDP
ncbi:MAG: prkC 6 [Planctomycetota bacterium]|nr:prkC 6 [Planctomycetota bacterium]